MEFSAFISSPFTLCLQILLVAIVTKLWRNRLALIDVPGPFLASFTRLWHAKQIKDGTQLNVLMGLHDELGHFVRIAPDEVSVSHPDAPRKLLLNPTKKGYFYQHLTFPDSSYRPAISYMNQKEKVEISRMLASAYATSSILQSETSIDRQVELLLGWLDRYSKSSAPMQLSEFFTFIGYDIIGEVLFSKPFGYLEKGSDIENSLQRGLQFGAYAAILPHFPWLMKVLVSPLFASLKLMPSDYNVEKAIKALDERRSNPDARYDSVARWLKTHEEHPDKLTAKQVQATVTANLSAGADTVSCALQSFVYHAIRHPTAWQRLRAEIDGAMKQGLCQDPVISFADAQKLPYLQACVKESIRIFPPNTMGLQREVPEGGITIGDRTFPAGTMLSVHGPSILLSKELWGSDAREFKPERWLSQSITAQEKYFMPFGLGYASCPGQNLAKVQLSKIIPTIVRDYNIRQVDPEQQWSYKPYVTCIPGNWPVYIAKRDMSDSN